MKRKIKIRGLAVSASVIFLVWGALIFLKGFWDIFRGEPEANLFSPQPWEFITRKQWLTWSGFEVTYGLACVGVAYLLWKYSKYLPLYIEKEINPGNGF